MGIKERREREKEERRVEIIDAAEKLFFSRKYEDVSMDAIAAAVELNKATIYLYFKNKETLFAEIVLRGIRLLKEEYQKVTAENLTGIETVLHIARAYMEFAKVHSDYLRVISFYGTEQFSSENPCTNEINGGYGTCRLILCNAVIKGIEDKTLRDNLDPYITAMQLTISFMGILSMEEKWKGVLNQEGISYEKFCNESIKSALLGICSDEVKADVIAGKYTLSLV